jgi:flagellar capping protein FliD
VKTPVKQIVKKVTLELIYDVIDERTRELKEEIKSINARIDQLHIRLDRIGQEHKEDFKTLNTRIDQMRQEYKEDFKTLNTRIDQMRQEYKEDFKSVNARIDQMHTRLDQIMHMLAELRR